jgi:ribosomal protein L21E
MKLENVKVGTKVRVKTEMNGDTLSFYTRHHGSVGTVIAAPDSAGDVEVEFADGATDYGHHSNLKRIKEKHS